MADLSQLSTSVLLEDLAKHRRYADKLVKSLGQRPYRDRELALIDALTERQVDIPGGAFPGTYRRPACRLKPLADHLVVLPEWEDDISKGGIIIVETAKAKPMQGEILACGPGRAEPSIGTLPMVVQVGDVVLFGRYAGVEVVLDEQRVLILREEDLLGVLPPKDVE